jgi:PKD domain-containing protein
MMPRKSLWFGLALATVVAVSMVASVDAKPKKKKNQRDQSGPPSVSLASDPVSVRACADESSRVRLIATARSPVNGPLRYKWTTNGGRLVGQGANTTWDLAGAQPGVYQAVVEVDDGRAFDCVAFSSISIVVTDCPPPPPEIVCPNVTVSCPERGSEDAPITFTATVSGGSPNIIPTYNWTISAGRIISGQGTTSITVDTKGMGGQSIRANLEIGGYGMRCPASCATAIEIIPKSRKFDEYYDIARNDEKARLDNYAIQLQSEPGSQGYIIVYPSRRARANDAQARATRISDYLVNSRGIDASRFTITIAAPREDWLFELWIVPQGATLPSPQR